MRTYKSKQHMILVIGLAVMALLGLFPPSISSVDILDNNVVRAGYSEPAGRAFLFAPGKPAMTERTLVVTRSIDYSRLAVEWMVMAMFTVVALGVLSIAEERRRLVEPVARYEEPRAA